jgi:hypothetical protein
MTTITVHEWKHRAAVFLLSLCAGFVLGVILGYLTS